MNRKFQQSLSLQKKLDILHEVDSGKIKKSEIAKKYGIAKSTVSTILKARDKIETACVLSKFEPSRKRMRVANNEEVETALIKWMNEARNQNLPITGAILLEKAHFFADALGIKEFLGSSGWLQRFKDRHGIICKKICGEEAAVNDEIVVDFVTNKFQSILSTYAEADVFNADETSLFWKALPSRTLTIKSTKCSGGKCSKERLTLLVACNMTGTEKLPLVVIGKAAKPRCFKGIKTLPVQYESSKKAWITADLFKKWVIQLDRKFEREGRNVCLILDNCSAHCVISGLKAIRVEYLPPNTTSKLQPCDQGIIKCIKAYYRREILLQTISCFDQGTTFSISLLDALNILRIAWKEVSSSTIANCFRKAGLTKEASSDIDPEIEESIKFDFSEAQAQNILPEDVTFDEYVSMDDEIMTSEPITDEAIISEIKCAESIDDNLHYSSETEEEDDNSEDHNVSSIEAFNALKTVRRFVMQTENSSESLDAVDKLEEFWKRTVDRKRKQLQITDFFKV